MAWAFADEAWTASRLSNQAADLRHRNAALQSQNEQYQRDIATVESGAAAEEVARQNGYARPGERIYVVGSPPPAPGSTGAGGVSSPAPPASPPARVRVGTVASGGPLDGLGRWWSALWTRR